jgi:hypothetical protein
MRGRVAKSDADNLWERFKPDLRFDADRTAEIAHVLHYADAGAFTRLPALDAFAARGLAS